MAMAMASSSPSSAQPLPPLPSDSAADQTSWADASDFLSLVCTELQVGELVHGENFSLFESMSALEIMDPKMDAGMTTSGPNTIEDAVERGAAPVSLGASEIVDIMDHLLACEATWHKGYSLAQTVFSCLYLLNLDRTSPNALLHAYCRTTRATCSLVRAAVSAAHTNEEEELFTIAFGLALEGEGDSKCLSGLHSVEEVVTRQLKGSKGVTVKKKVAEDIEPLQEDPNLEEGYCQAVLSRVRFRKAFYHTVVYMNKPQGRGLEMAHKHITAALSELRSIQESSEFLSRSCDGSSNSGKTTASGRRAIGFDASVNRRLSAPTPPRSINIVSWPETLAYFEKLLQDLDLVCSFSTKLSLEQLLQVLVDFQKREPDLVARAFLQILLVQDGKLFGQDRISDVLHGAFNLPQNVNNKEFESDDFISKSGELTLYLLRILCTNTAWQRRKLGKLLSEWGVLLQQADVISEGLLQKTLAPLKDKDWWENVIMGWAAEQTCWIARHFLMLGFQLELYSPSEYCMVYWYLDHVLLTELHYKQVKERPENKQATNSEVLDSFKKKGKKKKGSLKASEREIQTTPSVLLLQCYIDSCKGLSWMLAALTVDRKLGHRQTIFNTEQERFLQRFELFHKVPVPQSLSYIHFKEYSSQKNLSIKEQYQWSNHYFMTLQQHLKDLVHSLAKASNQSSISHSQRITEIRQLEQVALRNRIVLQIVDQAGPGDSLKVSFEFSQHPCFAVAAIKKT